MRAKRNRKRVDSYKDIVTRLAKEHHAEHRELRRLIEGADEGRLEWLCGLAREVREEYFGREVYLRGLVESSNRCSGGCYYCGLRAENQEINRYELSKEEIVESCERGYELGLRSFVIQSGERCDVGEKVARIVGRIKGSMPDVAVTLSMGEQKAEVYELWRRAGADRYLLRHESATKAHYERLHPARMSFEGRQGCLKVLRELGYQIGAGFMVGSPYQRSEELASEVEYLLRLQPEMVGIGPFIPQSNTPFAHERRGGVELTLLMVALSRVALPKALIPATTALASSDQMGCVKGVMAGANVTMPNITPPKYRADYAIYDGKKSLGTESGEGLEDLKGMLHRVGYKAVMSRGDHPDFRK